MISTGTLMLGKALLTASALLGFCIWQLLTLRRLRREREAREAARRASEAAGHATTMEQEPDHAGNRS